jgi:acetolactate synthase I/II/III large subunit
VDVNRRVFGVAYPEAETFAVNAEIGALLTALNQLWVPSGEAARRALPGVRAPAELDEQDEDGLVDPRALMAAVQRVVIDRSDALVMADAGNSFAWANSELRFEAPHRYRITSGFAAMTAISLGVVGAAMATGRAAVAVVGDGAMLMGNEVSTAVQYGVSAKWIVLNDRSYGMIRHGMEAIGMKPFATEIPTTDFAMLATALGATGLRVRRAEELDGVLREMLAIPGPVVVDVALDPRPAPPFGSRNKAISQGWE